MLVFFFQYQLSAYYNNSQNARNKYYQQLWNRYKGRQKIQQVMLLFMKNCIITDIKKYSYNVILIASVETLIIAHFILLGSTTKP